jgi:hypothetical protein
MFAGGQHTSEVALRCPTTQKMLTSKITLGNNEEFARVVDLESPLRESTEAVSDARDEYEEWAFTSRATALDFCRTMLTTASASIAIYFSVLKFLGRNALTHSVAGVISIVPPVLFLASTGTFAAALRPQLERVSRAEFANYREKRLRQLNRYVAAGMLTFLAGLLVAVGVFIQRSHLL